MTGVVVAACGGAMKGQWEERALGKGKKMKKEKRQREEWVGVRMANWFLERDVFWWDKSYEWVPFFA